MNSPSNKIAAVALLVCVGLVVSCGSRVRKGGDGRGLDQNDAQLQEDARTKAPVVFGTVVEAASGRALAGVEVKGPGGHRTWSDTEGRFRLEGFQVGVSGTLEASSASGLVGENRLRPLTGGELEVVIRLRRPR